MKLIFFGSGDFAIPTLERLVQSNCAAISLVITQPDRPVGRHQTPQATPVKLAAHRLGLPVQTHLPATVQADLGVVVYFGAIIPAAWLRQFPLGLLNVHPSLLPAYRGPAPIKRALLDGQQRTGVTIIKLDRGIDTGPVLAQQTLPITLVDTNLTLEQKLSGLGADLMLQVLPRYLAGSLQPTPQSSSGASYAARMTRSDGQLFLSDSPKRLWNTYRALQPWPGVYCMVGTKRIKIVEMIWDDGRPRAVRVQPAGKPTMTVADFKRGYPTISFPPIL